MQINDFSGGLNLRLDPSLISTNESVVCSNVDISKGSLVPIKDKTLVAGQAIARYSTYFDANQEWVWSASERSYVEYRNNLYYSTYNATEPGSLSVYDGVTHRPFGLALDTNIYTKVVTERATDPDMLDPLTNWSLAPSTVEGEAAAILEIGTQTITVEPGVPLAFTFRVTDGCIFILRHVASLAHIIYTTILGRYVETPYVINYTPGCTSLEITLYKLSSIPYTTYLLSLHITTPAEDYNTQLSENYSLTTGDTSGGWSGNFTIYEFHSCFYAILTDKYSFIQKTVTVIPNQPVEVKTLCFSSNCQLVVGDAINGYTYYDLSGGDIHGPTYETVQYLPAASTLTLKYVVKDISSPFNLSIYEAGVVIQSSIPKGALTLYDSVSGLESTPVYNATQYTQPDNRLSWTYNTLPSAPGDTIRVYTRDQVSGLYILRAELPTTATEYIIPYPLPDLGALNLTPRDLPPLNARYLVAAYGRLFTAKDTKVYFSNIADLEYWGALDYVEFDETITGIATVYRGLLVMSKFTCFLLSGDSPANFIKTTLSKAVGCVSHFSIAYLDNNAIWLSEEGLVTTSGGVISNLSYAQLGTMSGFKFGGVFVNPYATSSQTNYYLSFEQTEDYGDHVILVYNKLFNKFTIMENYGDAVYTKGSELYTSIGTTLYQAESGPPANLTYMSGKLSEGSLTNTKLYSEIEVVYIGDVVITIYINDIEVFTKSLSSINLSAAEIKLPQATQRGNTLQYKITGTGSVYEVEYKVKGEER